MNFENRRLIAAIAGSIGHIASRYDVPASDMDYLAVTTVVGELLRGVDPAPIRDLYAAGHALGLRLAETIGQDEAAAADIAHLQQLPATIPNSSDYASAEDRLVNLKRALSSLVSKSGYPSVTEGKLGNVIFALCMWEGELLELPTAAIAQTKPGHDPKQMLESSARAQAGAFEGAEVIDLTTLSGGFANETILFKIVGKDRHIWDLVARADTDLPLGIAGRDIGGEFFLLRYLYQNGLSVAEPIWLESDAERYGAKFLVTRKVEGNNFGTVVESQRLSSAQIKSLATELAKIHTVPLDKADPDLRRSHIDMGLVDVSMTDAVSNYIERWITLWRSTGREDSPTVEATLNWLHANIPNIEDAPVLVHGDYGVHNILIQGDEIGGVLDWEMSHLGDWAEDITWYLSAVATEADAEEFWRYYIEAGGRPVTNFQLAFYRVFGHFKLYVVALEAQLRFNTFSENEPKLLVLGSMFIQGPASQMAAAIETAEKAKIADKAAPITATTHPMT